MISNKSRISAVLLMVIVAGSVRAEDAKEVVVASAKELKGIKAKTITWKKDGAEMVRIPWISGYSKFGDANFEPFYMDATEVTIGQFKKFLRSSDYEPEDPIDWAELYKYSPTNDYPMVMVNWHDATAYAKWAGKRLPTEKEWEYAARGGLVGKEFPWGDFINFSTARDYANFFAGELRYRHHGILEELLALGKDKWVYCAPVGSFKPNGYGLYDMAGNVEEWCAGGGVLRGGSWLNPSYSLRVAYRNGLSPVVTSDNGFRCVLD
jgi:formylglycine-generating enzyme required for sulfatase activity